MKTKLLSTVIAILAITSAKAQTEQGSILVSGTTNLNFVSESIEGFDNNFNTFSAGLMGGYFLIDGLALGPVFDYQSISSGDSKISVSSLGVFARYYVNNAFFAGASFSSETTKSDSGNGETKLSGTSLDLEIGYAAFVADNIAIEPSIGYFTKGGDGDGTSGFGANIGITFFLQ